MTTAINTVYAIILAAGASSRLGSPKQLLEWRQRPLLAHAIANAQLVLSDRIIVVLGAHADEISGAIDLEPVTTVHNPQWADGLSASIRAGINALPTDATAVLLMLCDQPLVTAEHLRHLLAAWQTAPQRIAVSEYAAAFGVPAIFPNVFFAQLAAMQGDKGAKSLLIRQEDSLVKVPLAEAELDIDTHQDFQRLQALLH